MLNLPWLFNRCKTYLDYFIGVKLTLIVLQVLEQREGAWKGVVISDGRMAKPGYFPPDTVVLLDSSGESLVISTTNQALQSGQPALLLKTRWNLLHILRFHHYSWHPVLHGFYCWVNPGKLDVHHHDHRNTTKNVCLKLWIYLNQ